METVASPLSASTQPSQSLSNFDRCIQILKSADENKAENLSDFFIYLVEGPNASQYEDSQLLIALLQADDKTPLFQLLKLLYTNHYELLSNRWMNYMDSKEEFTSIFNLIQLIKDPATTKEVYGQQDTLAQLFINHLNEDNLSCLWTQLLASHIPAVLSFANKTVIHSVVVYVKAAPKLLSEWIKTVFPILESWGKLEFIDKEPIGFVYVFYDLINNQTEQQIVELLQTLKTDYPDALPFFLCALANEKFDSLVNFPEEGQGPLNSTSTKTELMWLCEVKRKTPIEWIIEDLRSLNEGEAEQEEVETRFASLINQVKWRLGDDDCTLKYFFDNFVGFDKNEIETWIAANRKTLDALPPYLLALAMGDPEARGVILELLPYWSDAQLIAIGRLMSGEELFDALSTQKIPAAQNYETSLMQEAPLDVLDNFCLKKYKSLKADLETLNALSEQQNPQVLLRLPKAQEEYTRFDKLLGPILFNPNSPLQFNGYSQYQSIVETIKAARPEIQHRYDAHKLQTTVELPQDSDSDWFDEPGQLLALFTTEMQYYLKINPVAETLKRNGIQSIEDFGVLGYDPSQQLLLNQLCKKILTALSSNGYAGDWNTVFFSTEFQAESAFRTLKMNEIPSEKQQELIPLACETFGIQATKQTGEIKSFQEIMLESLQLFYSSDILVCLYRYMHQAASSSLSERWETLRKHSIKSLAALKEKEEYKTVDIYRLQETFPFEILQDSKRHKKE